MTTDKKQYGLTSSPDMHAVKRVGPHRTIRPVYIDRLPPCNAACPAGENIQSWLAYTQEGKFLEAWQAITETNPFPAVHGRVCYHPCESSCIRNELDQTVSIHATERFLGDLAIKKDWRFEIKSASTDKRILIVGAGPSGLSAAYHLTRLGHSVTILEAGPVSGGMMHVGIPKYRLPRNILDAEIERITDAGVEIVLNHRVSNILEEQKNGDFDAVFIAIGAHISKRAFIPAVDAGRTLDALQFFEAVESGNPPQLGRRVAVYGGGNTAMDAARTARRLGAEETVIIYRRDQEHMPAHDFEAREAVEEGVKIQWLRTIKQIDSSTLTVERMELDDSGWPQPTGQFENLEADSVILATGHDVDSGFMRNVPDLEFKEDGTVKVDGHLMTGHPGFFAGGDVIPRERTVTAAVGHGKFAARNINIWLRNKRYKKPDSGPPVHFDMLNLWYYTDAEKRTEATADQTQRETTFEEINKGLDESAAVYEARRCLSCGNCFECDGCYAACPEDAIIKLGTGKRYRFDYDLCTGCAVCFEQCPCAAIEMVTDGG